MLRKTCELIKIIKDEFKIKFEVSNINVKWLCEVVVREYMNIKTVNSSLSTDALEPLIMALVERETDIPTILNSINYGDLQIMFDEYEASSKEYTDFKIFRNSLVKLLTEIIKKKYYSYLSYFICCYIIIKECTRFKHIKYETPEDFNEMRDSLCKS